MISCCMTLAIRSMILPCVLCVSVCPCLSETVCAHTFCMWLHCFDMSCPDLRMKTASTFLTRNTCSSRCAHFITQHPTSTLHPIVLGYSVLFSDHDISASVPCTHSAFSFQWLKLKTQTTKRNQLSEIRHDRSKDES